LLKAVEALLIPFVQYADATPPNACVYTTSSPVVIHVSPEQLQQHLGLHFVDQGFGKKGVLEFLQQLLKYSINTWHQGFVDKLYSSTSAVSIYNSIAKIKC